MGTIKRFGSLRVIIHTREHSPPHVHVSGPDWELTVEIANGAVEGPAVAAREAAEVLRWIEENRFYLLRRWKEIVG